MLCRYYRLNTLYIRAYKSACQPSFKSTHEHEFEVCVWGHLQGSELPRIAQPEGNKTRRLGGEKSDFQLFGFQAEMLVCLLSSFLTLSVCFCLSHTLCPSEPQLNWARKYRQAAKRLDYLNPYLDMYLHPFCIFLSIIVSIVCTGYVLSGQSFLSCLTSFAFQNKFMCV